MTPFVRSSSGGARYSSPQELYRDLPRRPGAVPGLWGHQVDMLRAYTANQHARDLALELPTGTGKTLTGLLIAEWTRRERLARVIYACPTRQLAQQVAAAARREGIDTAVLTGTHTAWPAAAEAAYEAADAIAVTTYSSIFNINPHLADADLILFDDAHAGEQYVGEAYSVTINRWKNPAEYQAVLDVVQSALDGVFIERLGAAQPDPGIGADVRLVVPLRQPGMVARLDSTLSTFGRPHKFPYAMIRGDLSSALVYVAYSGILIRPYLPPTHRNSLFTAARQRLYVSATLGEGGELERAFGRSGITPLALPEESAAPRYGRRFFVFPEFIEGADPLDLAREVVAGAGKALVLAPQTDVAMRDARALAQAGWPVLGVDDVASGMEPFARLVNGTCGLAARYDGLDLPGSACRLVALDGVPDQENLQERFLTIRARAGAALHERLRTRVVQGAGRCTRGPEDIAVVVILGAKLSRFLTRPEVVRALDPELQAELRFGRENSQGMLAADVILNVRAFLSQETDDTWRNEAEPAITEYRRDTLRVLPSGTSALAQAVGYEIRAWAAASVGRWEDAALNAHQVARLVGTGGTSTAGYRAFWMYLEAVWSDQAAEDSNSSPGRAAAQTLVRNAEQVMGLGSWVREMAPLPLMEVSPLSAADAVAVNAIAAQIEAGINQGKLLRRIGEMHAGLSERDPRKYEPALTQLGMLAGATAAKPPGKGRCDSTWCWSNELWLALEAKSDHEPTGVVPHKDVRQANDQLRLLASDRGVSVPPPGSATIVISPKPTVDDDGIAGAESHVFLLTPAEIKAIAYDMSAAWNVLVAGSAGRSGAQLRELIAASLSARGVLPTQLHERLTREPVGVTRGKDGN